MQITRWPKGGLNLDDSVEILSPDDWHYAANIVDGKSYNGKNGEKENVRGTNKLISSIVLSNSKCIGVIRSAEADVNYLFFWNNTASENCIVKLSDTAITLVLKWSGLNFQNAKEYRINGGGIAGNLLYFTDNFNQPRCVHLTRYSGGSTPATEEEILHIKRGPQFPPELIALGTATSGSAKVLDDVQFAYQYQYTDGQLSVISPWTTVIRSGLDPFNTFINSITMRVGSNETIPVLVTKIRFVARRGNNGTPFYILDQEAPFTPTVYSVNYDEQNLGVVDTSYTKQFELIPLTAKCEAITKSRAWFGNYVEGYDTPISGNVAISTLAFENDPNVNVPGPTFSPNSKFKFGVVFHDNNGRSAGVLDRDYVLTRSGVLARNATRQRIRYRITGTPPTWAKYYSLVMTKDLLKTYFIENWQVSANPDTGIYVKVSVAGTETYDTVWAADVRYLRLDTRIMNGIGIYYSFKDGDYVYLTNDATTTTYGPLKVRKIVGNFIYVDAVDVGNVSITYNFQVFSPNVAPEDLYYEIGQRRVITGGALDSTDYFVSGDCINVNVQTVGSPFWMPQMRVKPNDGAWNTDIGKPYIKTTLGQVNKKNFFKHSSPLIEGTVVNGLSEFNTGDEGNVPSEAVEIQKLLPTLKEATDGDVLLSICNSNTYSIYLDESRLSTNDGSSFLVASAKVIGDVRKQRSGFGTIHPESVHEEDGDVFFYDHLSRAFCRYASNGIFPISEYKVVDYFEDQAVLQTISTDVISGYDPFYKLLYVTFQTADTTTKRTIAWSLKKERWIGFYDFTPDKYVTGSKKIYSILNGSIYSHDNDSATGFNKFYDTSSTNTFRATNTDWIDGIGVWTKPGTYVQISHNGQAQVYQSVNVPLGKVVDPFTIVVTISGTWTGTAQIYVELKGGGFSSSSATTFSKNYTANVTNSNELVSLTAEFRAADILQIRTGFIGTGTPTYKIDIPAIGTTIYPDSTNNSVISLSFNDSPDVPKEWKVLQVQASPNFYSFVNANQVVGSTALKAEISNRHGQSTDIVNDTLNTEFEVDENMIYGEIRGDTATGGVLTGDPIYSNTLQVKTTFTGGSYKQLLMLKAGFEPSRGHTL